MKRIYADIAITKEIFELFKKQKAAHSQFQKDRMEVSKEYFSDVGFKVDGRDEEKVEFARDVHSASSSLGPWGVLLI